MLRSVRGVLHSWQLSMEKFFVSVIPSSLGGGLRKLSGALKGELGGLEPSFFGQRFAPLPAEHLSLQLFDLYFEISCLFSQKCVFPFKQYYALSQENILILETGDCLSEPLLYVQLSS